MNLLPGRQSKGGGRGGRGGVGGTKAGRAGSGGRGQRDRNAVTTDKNKAVKILKEEFSIVVLDPPTLTKTAYGSVDIENDYQSLAGAYTRPLLLSSSQTLVRDTLGGFSDNDDSG
jgi:hypothetical protein